MTEDPWRVLYVVANHEKRVAQHLAARDLDHYVPLFTADSRWTDRTVHLQKPLFPGYVFIRVDRDAKLTALKIPGVLALLGDDRSGFVAAAEVSRIREALLQGYPLRPHPRLDVGARVRVKDGVFSGVEGVVSELHRDCKVILSVPALESCFSLQMPIDNLTVLRPTPLQPQPRCSRAIQGSSPGA